MTGTIRMIGLFLVGVVAALRARGWDNEGHMMVAEIAWMSLGDSARTRSAQLLKLNPDYPRWIAHVTAAKRDQIAFVRAATWPDAIKSADGYINDGNTPLGSAATQNIGYADHLQHRYWHYIDVPFSTDGTALAQPLSPNAETQIERFQQALHARSSSDDVKSYDLVWLLHLVGDIHQPLHATSRFSASLPQGDRGGNLVTLCTLPRSRELHAFWDDIFGTSNSPASAIAAADRLPTASSRDAAVANDRVWIRESVATAKQSVYASPVGPGAGPYTLDAHYEETSLSVARSRIELAGARLAHLINSNLR